MFNLFRAEFKRTWIEFIRYPLDQISSIIIMTILFYGMFLSVHHIAGPNIDFGHRLDTIVVSYVLWNLVTFVIQGTAFGIQIEAQTGTLEQLFLSPFGTLKVLLIRALVSLSTYFVMIIGILLLTMVLTGRYLYFPAILILPLIAVLLAAYGLSLVMAALTILYKRVQQVVGLVQFGLLFLLALPVETWSGAFYALKIMLPMALGAGILRDLMARNLSLDLSLLSLAFINGIVYFIIGSLVFRWSQRKAKHQGILNGY
ncbi:MAG: ABC transporter permease [Cyanobacteria bacterium J06633_8]